MTAKGKWVVHKFGGTSLASAERYRGVLKILSALKAEKKSAPFAVVVSAMSGVTDALIQLVELAKAGKQEYLRSLENLIEKHRRTVQDLLPPSNQETLLKSLIQDQQDLSDILRAIFLSRSCSDRLMEWVAGHGEIWSARALNEYMISQGLNSKALDARKILIVEPLESSVEIDWNESRQRWSKWEHENSNEWVVVTGFIASTHEGVATTLKRNGSDYSASIFGSLLKASSIVIWTDVDGVLSADPKLVPDAVTLDELSYQEATELAYFGAKVVHPSTMTPAIEQEIPIWIKNTFRPEVPGTQIHSRPAKPNVNQPRVVKGFATISHMVLVNVEGPGMVGIPGVAQRLFGALREAGVSVVLISQASSEHSICFAVREGHSAQAKSAVAAAFHKELEDKRIQSISVIPQCSILAAVGDLMAHTPGVSAHFFGAMAKAGVSVRAIAQGSSERNISAVIDEKDSSRALRALHSAFYLSSQTISIGIIGVGTIGSSLLNQLKGEANRLKAEFNIDLRIRGICNSKKMILQDRPLALQEWEKQLEEQGVDLDLERLAKHIRAEYLPHSVIIDCTASDKITDHYIRWIDSGLHLITPNKKANTRSLEFYRELRRVARIRNRHFLYETNVGAGLPMITTLRDLVQTGDRIQKIEGIFSGTLSYLLSQFEEDKNFSAIVQEAKKKGLTEPDPKDDLSGMDVARKLVILGREMGLSIELSDIETESLIPYSDQEMKRRLLESKKRNEVLRYVGVVHENGQASVGLKSFSVAHPFARIQSGDNIVSFTSQRYRAQPLIVQGPGAGPEVTAGGVFADLLRLAYYLGGT